MNALVFQHVWYEGPAYILQALENRGYKTSILALWTALPFPAPENFDFLVVMGGPMSVHDHQNYQWMIAEKAFIQEWTKTGKPVLGICLGAQLLAEALGANVRPNPQKEIGWYPVRWLGSVLRAGEQHNGGMSTTVFHWHGETFDIPTTAVRIAESDACANQGFYAGSALGLQFHLEVTPESLKIMAREGSEELIPGGFVQSADEIAQLGANYCSAANQSLERLLDDLL